LAADADGTLGSGVAVTMMMICGVGGVGGVGGAGRAGVERLGTQPVRVAATAATTFIQISWTRSGVIRFIAVSLACLD